MALKKEKQIILEILEMYKNMSYLWDRRSVDYQNKRLRTEGFQKILEVYQNYDENADVKALKKKIDNLRTSYWKEQKKVQASGGEYVPTLWYFDSLSFLGEASSASHHQHYDRSSCRSPSEDQDPLKREYVSSLEEEGSDGDEEPTFEIEIPTSPVPVARKKIKLSQELETDHLASTCKKSVFINMREEEWQLIGKSIGLQLRGLSGRDLIVAQKLISDVIFNAHMGKLTENSRLELGASSSVRCSAQGSDVDPKYGSPSTTSI